MIRFTAQLLLSVFMLTVLPLQSMAAIKAVTCSPADQHSHFPRGTQANETVSHTHHDSQHSHFVNNEKAFTSFTKTAHADTSHHDIKCTHGAACCTGNALVSELPQLIISAAQTKAFATLTERFPTRPVSGPERPPRTALA